MLLYMHIIYYTYCRKNPLTQIQNSINTQLSLQPFKFASCNNFP